MFSSTVRRRCHLPIIAVIAARHARLGIPLRSLHQASHKQEKSALDEDFFSRRMEEREGSDVADVGRTIRILTTRLPFLLREGCLPLEILSDSITLELLPTTLGLPEIKGKTAYSTLSRLGTWSITTLVPGSHFTVDSQRLVGSARRCECLTVRFRLMDAQETFYTGLFHFHFDGSGKVARHVVEVIDKRVTPSQVVNWIMGRKTEVKLGYCCQATRDEEQRSGKRE